MTLTKVVVELLLPLLLPPLVFVEVVADVVVVDPLVVVVPTTAFKRERLSFVLNISFREESQNPSVKFSADQKRSRKKLVEWGFLANFESPSLQMTQECM